MPEAEGEGDVNADAIRVVLARIAEDPYRWYQGAYLSTGARITRGNSVRRYCFASWACQLAGVNVRQLLLRSPDGALVEEHARRLLGLSDAQASFIFWFSEMPNGRHPTVQEFQTMIGSVIGVDIREVET